MLINLWEKEVTGGQSGPVRRTVHKYNSFFCPEVAALFGLEGRTANGLPLGCRQSAGVLKKSSREVVSLAWTTADCPAKGSGRSAGHLTNYHRRVGSLLGFKSEGRTVRPWGADSPQVF